MKTKERARIMASKKKRRSHEPSAMGEEPHDPEAVMENKAFLSVSAIETSDDAIITKTSKGIITSWNRSAERIYGFPAHEVLGKPISILIPPGQKDEAPEILERIRRGENIHHYETARKRKDGQIIQVSVSVSPIKDKEGRIIGASTVARDITAEALGRRQAEEKLAAASQYARSLIESSLDPLVTISPAGKITDVNEATIKVTGVPREQLIGTDFSNYFTEPEKARDGYQKVFARGFVTDYPLTIRHRTGRLTDVLYNASVYKDPRGNVLGVFAAARDVTVQKQASQYARSLIESSLDPLVTIRVDGKITDVNEATIKVTGIPREELIGTDFSSYFTEPEKAREGYQQVFARGFVTDYPLTIHHKEGGLKDVLYNATVYKDTRGNVLGVFAAARDITARKRAEEEVHRLNAELEAKVISRTAQLEATNKALKDEIAERVRAEEESKRLQQEIQEERDRLSVLVNSITDEVWFTDTQKKFTLANPSALREFGLDSAGNGIEVEEFATNLELYRPDGSPRPIEENPALRALQGEVIKNQEEIVRTPATGELRYRQASSAPVRNDVGNIIGSVSVVRDITERKRAEEALRLTQASIDGAAEMVAWFTPEGSIFYVNDATCRTLGYTREELLKMKALDFSPGFTKEQYEEHWQEVRRRKSFTLEPLHRRKDGSTYTAEVLVNHVVYGGKEYIFAYGRDITERKRIEDELRKSRDELELRVQERTAEIQKQAGLIDLARDAIILGETDGTILFWSKGAVQQYGWEKEEALGRITRELLRTEFSVPRSEIISRLHRDGHWEGELTHTRKDGKKLKVLSRWVLKKTAGENDKIMIINHDITERLKLEEELRQAQKMEALGTLSGGIAHDFNNLLMPILLNLEMAVMDIKAGELPKLESMETAMAGANRGKELVQQIITFSRHKGEGLKPVDIAPIIKETIKFLRSTSPAMIRFETRVEDPSPLVMANATQIHQVLMNLVSNAVHAMEKDGGVLEITLEKLDKAASDGMKAGSYVGLKVKDTGCGMNREVREKAFDPFFTTKAKEKGTGLGLAVVHGIVKKHGGEIRVESEVGQGTTVSVFLPVHDEVKKGEAPSPILGVLTGSERILFVDDEEVQTRTVETMLKRLGYRVVVETDPRKALEIFRAQPDAFDLVITDQIMPDLTGIHLSKEMLAMHPDLPIIICSGYSEQVDEDKIAAFGIKGFIQKPFTVTEISQAIRNALGVR
jgi:PAS domain S-box-containing protein